MHADSEAQHRQQLLVGRFGEELLEEVDVEVGVERRRCGVEQFGCAAPIGAAAAQVPNAAACSRLECAAAQGDGGGARGVAPSDFC